MPSIASLISSRTPNAHCCLHNRYRLYISDIGYVNFPKMAAVIGLEGASSPDRHEPMGRPALGLKQTTVRLPVETVRRIEALLGPHQLAAFIREAVENELRRREGRS